MVRKTRKNKSASKGMTVPQLRKSFEHIETYARKNDLGAFRKEWKKTFGKPITESAAKDYLSFLKTADTHSQKGGAQPLTGAPLDYSLRAGSDPSTAANVPPYVQSGFGFANMDSFRLMSGLENITPRIPADMGRNDVISGGGKKRKTRKGQKGGALPSLSTAVSEFMTRPFTMQSPPSTGNILTMAAKGHTGEFDSPRPENNNLSFTESPTVYSATANNQLRTF
jgi:hypothetical protein